MAPFSTIGTAMQSVPQNMIGMASRQLRPTERMPDAISHVPRLIASVAQYAIMLQIDHVWSSGGVGSMSRLVYFEPHISILCAHWYVISSVLLEIAMSYPDILRRKSAALLGEFPCAGRGEPPLDLRPRWLLDLETHLWTVGCHVRKGRSWWRDDGD